MRIGAENALVGNGEWVFRTLRSPAVKDLGIMIGGWHDFRHTLATRFLKKWPTKVVSEILGHSDVHTTLVETEDFRAPLNELADELFS